MIRALARLRLDRAVRPFTCSTTTPGTISKMGAICGRANGAHNVIEDETHHGNGWGVPPTKKAAPQTAESTPAPSPESATRPTSQSKKSNTDTERNSVKQDISQVKDAIIKAMKREGYDDGSLGPIFIRLAWHSCGTYDAATKTGGSSSGATMRFPPERDDPENSGLAIARDALEPVHERYPWLSYADLWILAGTLAIKQLGGPEIEVKIGRQDHPGPTSPIPNGRLPKPESGIEPGVDEGTNRVKGWQKLAESMRVIFTRMGFSEQETVALICGGHVFGRGHRQHTGYQGAWVENPVEFSSEYAADLVGDEWRLVDGSDPKDQADIPDEVLPAPGKRQYVSKPHDEHPQMMLPSDMVLLWDDKFGEWTKKYAEDQALLSKDFAAAWKQLIELGCDGIIH